MHSPGTKVELRGLLLDENLVFRFEKPIPLTCVDPGGIGPIYSPDPIIESFMLDFSFSQIALSVRVGEREESVILTLPN